MGTDLVFSDVSLLYFIFLGLVLERLWQLSDVKILNGGKIYWLQIQTMKF